LSSVWKSETFLRPMNGGYFSEYIYLMSRESPEAMHRLEQECVTLRSDRSCFSLDHGPCCWTVGCETCDVIWGVQMESENWESEHSRSLETQKIWWVYPWTIILRMRDRLSDVSARLAADHLICQADKNHKCRKIQHNESFIMRICSTWLNWCDTAIASFWDGWKRHRKPYPASELSCYMTFTYIWIIRLHLFIYVQREKF
jgi:hypothetical protein